MSPTPNKDLGVLTAHAEDGFPRETPRNDKIPDKLSTGGRIRRLLFGRRKSRSSSLCMGSSSRLQSLKAETRVPHIETWMTPGHREPKIESSEIPKFSVREPGTHESASTNPFLSRPMLANTPRLSPPDASKPLSSHRVSEPPAIPYLNMPRRDTRPMKTLKLIENQPRRYQKSQF